MKIEKEILYIEKTMDNADANEFASVIYQDDIQEVVIQNSELSSSILQLLMCIAQTKKVSSEDSYIQLLFENLRYR